MDLNSKVNVAKERSGERKTGQREVSNLRNKRCFKKKMWARLPVIMVSAQVTALFPAYFSAAQRIQSAQHLSHAPLRGQHL
jgi:hypothetical protein